MKVSIHQPCYIPYLGVFYKIWCSDIFVYLDNVQYSKGYVYDCNRIKTSQGESRLKIPLERQLGDLLTDVKPKNFLGWREKHLKTIEMNYKKAPYFLEFFDLFADKLMADYESLAELNIVLMDLLMKWFGWDIITMKSSEMKLCTRSEARVIDIVNRLCGDVYISGIGGRQYQNEDHFKASGIRLEYSDFFSMEYGQQWGKFLPNMSVIDYAMNEGHDIGSFFARIREEGHG